MLLAIAIAAAAVIVVLVIAWALQRRLIYFPDTRAPGAAAAVLPRAEDAVLTTADGLELAAWYVPPATDASGAAVIVFDGNAGNRADRAPLAAALARAGLGVLLLDYRGYGGNPGTPTEDGLAADARAARAYLVDRPDVDAGRIVYFGESLGAAVAVTLAAEHPPAALVLRSPFASLAEIARVHYPFVPAGLLLMDRYPSIDTIASVPAPVLIIAGEDDRIVPPEQSRRLFESAVAPKQFVVIPGADHNDPDLFGGDRLIAATVDFLRRQAGFPLSAPE